MQSEDRTVSRRIARTGPTWWIGGALSCGLVAILVLTSSGVTAGAASDPAVPTSALHQSGAVTSLGSDLIALADDGDSGPFAPYAGQPVSVQGAIVESVVSDTSFWVGADEAHRLFVIVSAAASGVAPGDVVSFEGTLTALEPGFHVSLLIPSSIDLELLSQQMHYVVTTTVTVEEPSG